MSKDYYKILGVAEFDSAENIKTAYRRLARKCHPDIAGESAEALLRFKDINEAYETLSNRIKREEYDRARRFYNYAKKENKTVEKNNNVTKEKVKKDENLNFNWNTFFNKKNKHKHEEKKDLQPIKGNDIYTDIEITTLEAINGTIKSINMLQTHICPKCNGRRFANGSFCPNCKGKGEISEYKKFNIKIPAGISNKSKIRLSGEGHAGKNGGKNGDLYVTVSIRESDLFKAEGLNIIKKLPITPSEAVLGANITFPTSSGNVNIKLAPRTQNGQKIRLSGCGLSKNNQIGDLILTIEIQIPQKLSKEELDLYMKLEKLSTSNIRENLI